MDVLRQNIHVMITVLKLYFKFNVLQIKYADVHLSIT